MLEAYGPQGWWPLVNASTGESEYRGTVTGSDRECLEIAVGAILTQSVSWKNVEKAVTGLKCNGFLEPRRLIEIPLDQLALMIRSTGYYNQKALKIREFLTWLKGHNYSFSDLRQMNTPDLRAELLSVRGIGPETADSILLYALGKQVFVVDAYTRRIFTRIGFLKGKEKYTEIQMLFHECIQADVKTYREYHALIVEHAKEACRKTPVCDKCVIRDRCSYYTGNLLQS